MIEIANLTPDHIDKDFLKKIAWAVLCGEKKRGIGLSVVLVGQGRIRQLSRHYRRKNRVTDVLAFPYARGPETGSVVFQKEMGLGEIVICLTEVKKNAHRFGSTLEKELGICLIHGILHLLGYEHEDSDARTESMQKKQDFYLSRLLKSS